jgi:hypothetical protein
MASRERRLGAYAALAILMIALAWWGSQSASSTAPAATTQHSMQRAAATTNAGAAPALDLRTTDPEAHVVIDGVDVEKTELCIGDENLISVRAHATRPELAGELRILIDGELGDRVALRPLDYLTPAGVPPRVTAFVDPDHPVEIEIPKFVVRKCNRKRSLTIEHRVVSNLPDHMELSARVSGDAAFHPVRYHWDFGDGTTAVTDTRFVEKSFRHREQHARLSYMLVSCEAEAANGERVRGRDALALMNDAYDNLRRLGIVTLEFDKPRFPQANAAGIVEVPVRIWHRYPEAVTITTLTEVRVENAPGAGKQQERTLAVDTILPASRIAPSGSTFTVRLDTKADPRLAYVIYRFAGTTENGLAVAGELSVMRPTDLPTPEHHIALTDEKLAAKIIAAQRLLDRQYVTDEDIWRLEREGKLDGATLEPVGLASANSPHPAPTRRGSPR